MLSLKAGDYIKMAVTHLTHPFHLYSLCFCVCVCVCVRAYAGTQIFLRSYCCFKAVEGFRVDELLPLCIGKYPNDEGGHVLSGICVVFVRQTQGRHQITPNIIIEKYS